MPKCTCGGMIKPDVVLYEEGLDDVYDPGICKSNFRGGGSDHRRNIPGCVSGSRTDRLFPGKSSGGDQQGADTERQICGSSY